MQSLCIVLVPITLSYIILIQALELDVSGYEPCIFHLIGHDSENRRLSQNLIDLILLKNQGGQQWTLSSLPAPNMDPGWVLLGTPLKFKERCSVNIISHPLGRFERKLYSVCGTRLYDPNNLFILILGSKADCLEKTNFGSPILADIFLLYLSRDRSEAEFGNLFCPTCTSQYSYLRSTRFPPRAINSLKTMAQFSTVFRSKSIEPVLLARGNWVSDDNTWYDLKTCQHLYKKRKDTLLHQLGCIPMNIFLENAAIHLNSSLIFSKEPTKGLI
jgi:hypothetical protein